MMLKHPLKESMQLIQIFAKQHFLKREAKEKRRQAELAGPQLRDSQYFLMEKIIFLINFCPIMAASPFSHPNFYV
jgi:hypothetical protein